MTWRGLVFHLRFVTDEHTSPSAFGRGRYGKNVFLKGKRKAKHGRIHPAVFPGSVGPRLWPRRLSGRRRVCASKTAMNPRKQERRSPAGRARTRVPMRLLEGAVTPIRVTGRTAPARGGLTHRPTAQRTAQNASGTSHQCAPPCKRRLTAATANDRSRPHTGAALQQTPAAPIGVLGCESARLGQRRWLVFETGQV